MEITTGTIKVASLQAKVSLVLNGLTYCKKAEPIQVIGKTKNYTILERYEAQRDSKGKEIVGRKFRVANNLVGLYFD